MKTLEQIKNKVVTSLKRKDHNQELITDWETHDFIYGTYEELINKAAQLYADEFAKAFYDWISSEDGINTIHDLQLVGELPKGIPSFDQLKPHFKSSLKEKV